MANKIKLGQKPENFTKTIAFQSLEGEDLEIEVVFKYRTRKEFGEFFDKMFADAGETAPKPVAAQDYMTTMMVKSGEKNADYLLAIATGWNLDIPFNRANIEQMCDEFPGAAAAIMQGYYTAITEGRVKN